MKTAARRNRILVLYLMLLLALFAFGRIAKAEEVPKPAAQASAPVPSPAPSPAQVPPSCEPREGGHHIPNQRELSPEDNEWLGRVVWEELQKNADPGQRDLSGDQVRALIDQAERNRQEVVITLADLYTLMKSPALCQSQAAPAACAQTAPRGEAFGLDLGRVFR